MDIREINKWVRWIGDNEEDLPFSYDDFLDAENKYEFLDAYRDDIRSIPDSPSWLAPDLDKEMETLSEEYEGKSFKDIPMAYKKKLAKQNNIDLKTLEAEWDKTIAEKQEEELKKQKKIEKAEDITQQYKKQSDWSVKLLKGFPFIGGRELANPYAQKHAGRGEYAQAVINEIAGKTAGTLDFVPGFSIAAPIIRSTQKWAADEPVATRETALDLGFGIVGPLSKIPGVRAFGGKVLNKTKDIIGKSRVDDYGKELLKGPGKIVKDLFTTTAGYGLGRKVGLQTAEDLDMPKEQDYNKAINSVIKMFSDDWKKGKNIPDDNSPAVVKTAYEKYSEDLE